MKVPFYQNGAFTRQSATRWFSKANHGKAKAETALAFDGSVSNELSLCTFFNLPAVGNITLLASLFVHLSVGHFDFFKVEAE